MKRMSLLLSALLFAQAGFCADHKAPPLFAASKCKADYEYHFLNRAAAGDDLVGAELLLESGADPDGKGYAQNSGCFMKGEFSSPLMVAVDRHNAAMVRLLLDAGADPNLLEAENVSPTDSARKKGLKYILDLLVKHGGKDAQAAP